MRLVPIREVLALDAGETVPSIRGRITDVSDRRDGAPPGKDPWSFQKLTVQDETGSVVVKVWDRDAFSKAIKGQTYCFACNEGQKGLTGLKVKEDDYRGKVSKIINATGTAHIDPVDGQQQAPQAAPAAPQAQQAPTPPPAQNGHAPSAPAQTAPPPASNGHSKDGRTDIKKHLNKLANLYLDCMNAAEYVQAIWETSKGKAGDERVMSQEKFDACVGSLFIQCCKDQLHFGAPTGQFRE